jgi:hypothetical protein
MRFADVLPPLREFFLLEGAERTIAAYTPEQHARVAELCAAGDERLRVAVTTTPDVEACLLLRDALASFTLARAVARDAGLDETALARMDCATEIPALGPDPLDGSEGRTELVQRALATTDRLYLDRLDAAKLGRLRVALEQAARVMRRGMEARSHFQLQAVGWARLAAVALLVIPGAWLLGSAWGPQNVAVGKPVHVSSSGRDGLDGKDLATGRLGFTYAVQTGEEASPNVVIDLEAEYAIDRLEVFNRADGWWGDCLPLVLELSHDGHTYVELARREDYFGFDKPWVVRAGGQTSRFVRARVARGDSYLALGRLRVIGRKP